MLVEKANYNINSDDDYFSCHISCDNQDSCRTTIEAKNNETVCCNAAFICN